MCIKQMHALLANQTPSPALTIDWREDHKSPSIRG
jgi:hypothetical protein